MTSQLKYRRITNYFNFPRTKYFHKKCRTKIKSLWGLTLSKFPRDGCYRPRCMVGYTQKNVRQIMQKPSPLNCIALSNLNVQYVGPLWSEFYELWQFRTHNVNNVDISQPRFTRQASYVMTFSLQCGVRMRRVVCTA